MKQHITKIQWDELTDSAKLEFVTKANCNNENFFLPTIGQMIEFLEDDLRLIRSPVYNSSSEYIIEMVDAFKIQVAEELANALWEAVREKLK